VTAHIWRRHLLSTAYKQSNKNCTSSIRTALHQYELHTLAISQTGVTEYRLILHTSKATRTALHQYELHFINKTNFINTNCIHLAAHQIHLKKTNLGKQVAASEYATDHAAAAAAVGRWAAGDPGRGGGGEGTDLEPA